MNKEEFALWKQHETTKLLHANLKERIEDFKEALSKSAGDEPKSDKFITGIILGFSEVIAWVPEEVEDDKDSGT